MLWLARLERAYSAAVTNPDEKKMLMRVIPSTGEKIPAAGLGTWQTFDIGESAAERAPLKEVLSLFYELGGRVVDSSPMYGRSEKVLGEIAAELSLTRKIFFATKVWTRGREDGIRQMKNSARLFGTEVIDLMQIHNLVDWRTHMETLLRMKEEGNFRYIGITHYTTAAFGELAAVLKEYPVDFLQIPYSIAVREAENELLPLAAEKKTAVLVNRPFEGGSLFRKTAGKELPDWAADFGCESWAQFFLKYLLGNEAVTCVIPATSKPSHLKDNMRAGLGRLPSAEERVRMARLIDGL